MTTVDLIGMARPFWFTPIDEAAPTAASAVLERFSTPLTNANLATNLAWAHAGRRDLVQYLLHRVTDQGHMRVPSDVIVDQFWWFLSNMQR